MKWTKLGMLFCPDRRYSWMRTHAANPVAEWRGGDLFRVYFSSRDDHKRAHIGYVDVDIKNPTEILSVSQEPILVPGVTGLFDDSGVSIGCIVPHQGRRYLYYLGWNLGVTVPWRNSIGLAISEGVDAPFIKVSPAPIMDRDRVDPYSISYPWVMIDEGRWRMWYGSNLRWGSEQRDMDHLIKYAESDDGIHWRREGKVALPFQAEGEFAMAKPCVVRDEGLYRMWYAFRGEAYRIGYAESADGLDWTRKDAEAGISVSDTGWDSETVDYPFVFDHAGKRYMLYNGNSYGATGFGLAVLEEK